jgi:hypothetical protein
VTAGAVFFVLHVEGLLSIMASAAEISLGDLLHVYLVRPVRHLKYLVMAVDTLEPLSYQVSFMAEDYRRSVFGCEGQITAANLLRKSAERNRQVCRDHGYHEQPFHNLVPHAKLIVLHLFLENSFCEIIYFTIVEVTIRLKYIH